jgi:hypothetical protein
LPGGGIHRGRQGIYPYRDTVGCVAKAVDTREASVTEVDDVDAIGSGINGNTYGRLPATRLLVAFVLPIDHGDCPH